MARLQSKRFDEPDEFITLPLVTEQVVFLGEVQVARIVHQPGWSWAEHVKPVARTPSCQHHHQAIALEGEVEIETDTGARRIIRAGEAYEVPPGHNARVIGDRPFVTIEFAGVHGWGKPAEASERVVATLLVTDIVDSTKVAARLGDAAWKELLAQHSAGVRIQLDRFRGIEVHTTGDGFRALCGRDP
jgi:mannose-6-phosphate isomerase-like protein (cupin superfamily)